MKKEGFVWREVPGWLRGKDWEKQAETEEENGGVVRLDKVAPLITDPPPLTPPSCKINTYFGCTAKELDFFPYVEKLIDI